MSVEEWAVRWTIALVSAVVIVGLICIVFALCEVKIRRGL